MWSLTMMIIKQIRMKKQQKIIFWVKQLGKVSISKLKIGTFNKVKIAHHIPTNQKVAIKIIDKSSIQNQADIKRLNLELKILRKVRHPNIAQLYEILENKEFLFLVTEHVSRGQLFDHILNNQKLTEFQACKFLQQLLDAVEYLHSLGVVHRDLKPQNILLDFKFNVKVIDFGLSNVYSKQQKLFTACGSPCYAPPEMLSGKSYNGLKSDIWSIGIILYAMCFGYLPFDNPNTKQLYVQITQGKYEVPEHASKELFNILSRILEVNPQKRATIEQIRSHPFCKFSPFQSIPGIIVGLSDIPFEEQIQSQIIEQIYFEKNFNQAQKQQFRKKLKHSIKFNKHNELSSTYYLILQRNLKNKNLTVLNYYSSKNNVINRYSIAEKVKQSYEKRLKQRLQNSRYQNNSGKYKHSSQKDSGTKNQNKRKSVQKNHPTIQNQNTTPNSKTEKKQKISKIFLQDKTIEKDLLKKVRKIKTTNTKRHSETKQNIQARLFKKTRLNFNQIQLEQKKVLKQTLKLNSNQKNKNKMKTEKEKSSRVRNKSAGSGTYFHKQKSPQKNNFKHQRKAKSPQNIFHKLNQKHQFSEKRKRAQSQNVFYQKASNFNTINYNKKKLNRKGNINERVNERGNEKVYERVNEKIKKKSPQKKVKKLKSKQMNQFIVEAID